VVSEPEEALVCEAQETLISVEQVRILSGSVDVEIIEELVDGAAAK